MTDKLKTTCYNCKHHRLCHLRNQLQNVILENVSMFDVDTSNDWQKIFEFTAGACTEYKEVT